MSRGGTRESHRCPAPTRAARARPRWASASATLAGSSYRSPGAPCEPSGIVRPPPHGRIALVAMKTGRLKGRVAFVTGASRGIGEAIGRRFAVEGARVAFAARDELACQRIAEDVTREGGEAVALGCDVTLPISVSSSIASIVANWGRIDVLVNNA